MGVGRGLAGLAGVILAGGENRRMGKNKAFLTLDGRMFLWRIIGTLTPLFRDLILVTREPEQYVGFPVRPVTDLYPERGPLTGIISGLAASNDRYNFCVACDMPFIRTDLVQYMMKRVSGREALVPFVSVRTGEEKGRRWFQPLHAVYGRGCLPVLERSLREGRRSLRELIPSLDVRVLGEKEITPFDPMLQSFRSINTVEEYSRWCVRTA